MSLSTTLFVLASGAAIALAGCATSPALGERGPATAVEPDQAISTERASCSKCGMKLLPDGA